MNIYLVIPSIRNLDFLVSWDKTHAFEAVHILVVEDSERKKIKIPKVRCRSITHVCHQDIKKDLGKNAWIFPHKSAAIRSYGFLKAYQAGADIIMTLDDDCYPDTPNFVNGHLQNLALQLPTNWTPTYPFRDTMFTRGFPYFVRNKVAVLVSHGLWSEVPDFDGMTQLQRFGQTFPNLPEILHIIPPGMFFPMSSMNLAFRREATVLMYQLLMGENAKGQKVYPDRFDDIWSGVFAKKILDHLGYGVVSGSPFIRHARASDVMTNIKKEATGIELNEQLWQVVKDIKLTRKTVLGCYQELTKKLKIPQEKYFLELKSAMQIWASFFNPK